MNTETIKQLLDEVIADTKQIETREAELATACELLSQDAAVQAAFQDGVSHERRRVYFLITSQLATLQRGGVNALVLGALRQSIMEAE